LTIAGIVIACFSAGCFIGALLCIFIADVLGRRKTIFLGTIFMIIGAIIQASSFTLAQFIAGRTILGFGNGINSATVPTWQSETAKSHRRGFLILMESAFIAGGVCIAYWVSLGCYYSESSFSWRFPIALEVVFALIVVIFVLPLPESPRWLILQGYEQEALIVIGALSDLPPDDQYVRDEFDIIKATVLEMTRGGPADLFTRGKEKHLQRTVLAYVLQMMHKLCGIHFIVYYSTYIYQTQFSRSPFTARILAATTTTEYFIAGCAAAFIVDRIGRRSLLLTGTAGMLLCLVIIAIMARFADTADDIPAIVFMYIFTAFFAIGWLGIGWLYPAELVPLRIRGPANALAVSAHWAFNFMVAMITPVAFARIGWKTWIIFIAL